MDLVRSRASFNYQFPLNHEKQMRFSSTLMLVAGAAALTACAGENTAAPTGPASVAAKASVLQAALSRGDRLATIEWEGNSPKLYLQNADGSDRTQVHFTYVSTHVTGNYPPRLLPVTDESLVSIQRLKWSPDGRQLAVLLMPAYHAAQVVVMTADGYGTRTVSPNSQTMYGDIEWSPDSRRIGYIMATGPYGLLPDLFVTDLGPDNVTRVTTGGKMSGYDAFRFDASGNRLLFTEHVGWADDGVSVLSRFGTADLTTGTVSYGDQVVGEPQGFARDGSWALFIRSGKLGREVVKHALPSGAETTLATGTDLYNAVVQEGDRDAIVVSPAGKDGSMTFTLLGLESPDDWRGQIETPKSAAWIALLRR
jgi:hypothetical protein